MVHLYLQKLVKTLILFTLFSSVILDQDNMCHMYHLEAIETSNLVFVATTTEGPYPATVSDYNDSNDLLAWGKAGSPGLTEERKSVTQGVPITINFNVYHVDKDNNVTPLNNAHFYIWHCDAVGVYSAISSQNSLGQKWLRGVQPIVDGKVAFKTIIPGWYTGRILHYHIRVHLDSDAAGTYEMTSQVFFEQSFKTDVLDKVSIYSSSKQQYTNLSQDNVYTAISESLRDRLFLKLEGDLTNGYTTTFNMGISTAGLNENANTMGGGAPPTGNNENMNITGAFNSSSWVFSSVFALSVINFIWLFV